jgi:malate synthase
MKNGASLDDGRKVDRGLYDKIRDEEVGRLGGVKEGRYRESVAILDELVDTGRFHDFLTTIAYEKLD